MKQDTNKTRVYQHLSLMERETIALGLAAGKSKADWARELGRDKSTLTREVKRNFSVIYNCKYRAHRYVFSDAR